MSGDISASALAMQDGGMHYKAMPIQPFEYIHALDPFADGRVSCYVIRWRPEVGLQDLREARRFLDLLIESEAAKGTT